MRRLRTRSLVTADRIHLRLRHLLTLGASFDLLNLRPGFLQLLAGLQ
jgi:hypothetical protein